MRNLIAACTIAAATTAVVAQQAASPTFEITSVKISAPGAGRSGRLSPGLFEQTGISLRALVGMAYPGDVTGGPSWADADHFDVVGKGDFPMSAYLPGADGSGPPVYLMLRSLMADRFKLVVHPATEERPVYTLEYARSDKKAGPGLHRTNIDCAAVLAAVARGDAPVVPAGARRPPCSMRRGPGTITGNAISMSQLAAVLSSIADRQVLERTGETGWFDVDLTWAELHAGPSGPLPLGAASPRPGDDVPTVFTALREQLGLKLESTRGPVNVVVIDRAQRPSEN